MQVTTAEDHKRGVIEFHKPGCAHLRSKEVLSTSEKTADDLRSYRDEAKNLGAPNPVAPCLRREI